MSYLKGIHCFDFWFLQASMNICILPHTNAQVTTKSKYVGCCMIPLAIPTSSLS